jgi:hypothetical protein
MRDDATLGKMGERNWSYVASAPIVDSALGIELFLYLVGGLG